MSSNPTPQKSLLLPVRWIEGDLYSLRAISIYVSDETIGVIEISHMKYKTSRKAQVKGRTHRYRGVGEGDGA